MSCCPATQGAKRIRGCQVSSSRPYGAKAQDRDSTRNNATEPLLPSLRRCDSDVSRWDGRDSCGRLLGGRRQEPQEYWDDRHGRGMSVSQAQVGSHRNGSVRRNVDVPPRPKPRHKHPSTGRRVSLVPDDPIPFFVPIASAIVHEGPNEGPRSALPVQGRIRAPTTPRSAHTTQSCPNPMPNVAARYRADILGAAGPPAVPASGNAVVRSFPSHVVPFVIAQAASSRDRPSSASPPPPARTPCG